MTTTEPIDGAWTAHRPYLLDLAFRMLGNLGDAEDAVQDAYARLLRVDLSTIGDLRAWLVVVVSRRHSISSLQSFRQTSSVRRSSGFRVRKRSRPQEA